MIRSAAVAVGVCLAFAGVSAASAATWVLMPISANVGDLVGVSCVSASNCLAIPQPYGGPFSISDGHILKWNGTTWKAVPGPTGALYLTGIACTSATFCMAVGQREISTATGTTHLAGAWSWNGSTWRSRSAYNPKSIDNGFNAIKCASATSCEAVGYHSDDKTFTYPLAEFWNGSTWTRHSLARQDCSF